MHIEPMKPLGLALAMAEHGLFVFPLQANTKIPYKGTHGLLDATCDQDKIRAWWECWPDANIGIATGLSKLTVLDVDTKNNIDGEASLVKLLNGHHTIPITLEVRTPSGGRHIYFSTPGGMDVKNSAGKIGPGLDIRGDGGYVVAAGSVIKGSEHDGIYEIREDEEIAALPDWLTALVANPQRPIDDSSAVNHNVIAEGSRNDTMFRYACSLFTKGLSDDAIWGAFQAENNARCNPPLEDRELRSIINSAHNYVPEETTGTFIHPEPITTDEWTNARSTPDCIVQDYLYADVACFIAPGGMGKTTLKLFEAIHIALGLPLYGLNIDKPGPVLIITAEDSREMLVARLRAIAHEMQLNTADIATVMQRVRISDVSGNGFKLTAIYGDVVMPSDNLDLIIEVCEKIKPVLIVIDPAVSFGVGESRVNDAEQGLIEAARKLRRALNCCVQYIHHSGKQNAREKSIDQYAGRGGSAFADGSRMVHVLQSLTPSEWLAETGTELFSGESGLRLARPKMSYCAPVGDILIRRAGFHFEPVERITTSKQAKLEANANQVWQLLTSELSQVRYPSQNYLEELDTELTRTEIRSAVQLLLASQRVEYRDVPNVGARGGKRVYLHPIVMLNENGAANERLAEK